MERGQVRYDDTDTTIHYIRGNACMEYVKKLKEIALAPLKDLSGLDEMAFTDWHVVRRYQRQ